MKLSICVKYKNYIFTILILLLQIPVLAQDSVSTEDLFEMDIEELMNVEVTSFSKRSEKSSKAPGTVYVWTEEQIKASLREKEVLLKEIHHRVKNNLQVVSSLLYLQSETVADPAVLNMFQDSQHRVRSMALVHERLYQAKDLSRIDFSDYVSDLANHLLSSYSVSADRVKLELEADSVALDVDTAVPCGLIINELVSNSLKHAFPAHSATKIGGQELADGQDREAQQNPTASSPGKIRIQLRLEAGGHLQLLVSDNGVGVPADFDIENTESLGLLLVNSLVRQLRGTLELSTAEGTEFKIRFRLPESRGGEPPLAG